MIRIMLSTSLLVVIWTIPIMNGFSFAPVSLHENRNSPDRCSRLLKSIDFRFQHPQQQQKVVSYTLLQAASHRRNLDNDQFEYEEDYEDDYDDAYEYESNYNQRRKQKNYDYNNNYKDDEYDYDEDYEYYDDDMEDNNYYEKYDYEELDLNDESQSLYEWESYGSTDILLPTISSSSSSDNNSDNNKLPTAIVHFIGGTFVGSLPPRIAYRSFLEGLSQHYGNIVIIATSIPLTDSTPLSSNDGILPKVISPLNHWKQIQTIRRNLYQTIQYVLYDEYQDRNLVDQIPIVGIGHSLGGRLQVLLHSHPKQEIQKIQQDIYDKYDDEYRSRSRSRSKRRRQANAKKKRRENIGNVLISFNNFNAPRSIPLLDEANLLWKTSRGLSQRLIQILRGDYDDDDDDDDDEFFNSRKQRRKRSQDYDSMKDDMDDDLYRRPRRRRQSQSQNDNDKDDDKDIFEFDPSPEKLWNIIRQSSFVPQSVKPDKVKAKNDKYENEDDDYYDDDDDDYYERNKRSRRQRSQPQPSSFSYTVPRNLIIQFDNDELDQSAEFARRFMEANASTNTSDNNDENNNHHKNNNSTSDATVAFSSVPNEPDPSSSPPPKQQQQSQSKPQQMLDLKFARLRGNHLTPCTSPGDGNLFLDNENANERNDDDDDDKKNDDSNETAKSRMKKQRMSRKQERRNQELQDLITSVSSYIQFLVHDNAVTASFTATDNNKKGEKEKEKETVEETIAQSSSSSSSLSSSTNREKKNNEEGFYKQ